MTFWCCLFRRVRTEQLSRHRSERRRSRWRRWRRTASPGRWCWAERAAAFFRGWNPGDWAAADYLRREELCLANAVPSAEGAIQIAMEETARTLHGTAALVIGYGRIGMALAPRLRGLGMDVTVCARRCETRALAEMQGFAAVPMEQLPAAAKAAPVIFNTVPALVLDETVLKGLPQETLVIDLASRPGGTDFEAAKRLRTRVVWALSLPPEMRR